MNFKLFSLKDSEKRVAEYIAESIVTEKNPPSTIKNVNIRQASLSELLYVSSLRVTVFYPDLMSNGAFHVRILDKLRTRMAEGAVCLMATGEETLTSAKSQDYRHIHLLGTVEISPADFKNTSMETIGSERKLYVMDLAIRASARRQGLASQLLAAIEDYARYHSYGELYLHVELDNEPARLLYKKHGFVEIPINEDWAIEFTKKKLHKPPESYVMLWRQVNRFDQALCK